MIDILELQTIYAKFEDDLSRKIFVNRLLYSVTGDKNYIENIAMDRPVNRKFKLREISRQQIIERVNESEKPVILYGAGMFGRNFLGEVGERKVKCFWDRKEVGNIQSVAVERPGTNYDGEFVIVSVSALYIDDIIGQLQMLGVEDHKILVPDLSKTEDLENQYFDRDIIKFSKNEVFVDGGSYNFGTSRLLLEKFRSVKTIYAFEPDSNHWENVDDGIRDSRFDRVVFIKKGLWNEEALLSFESDMSESRISDSGTAKIAVTSIDQAIGEPVTFIKMDIEGSELEALKGAANHIIADKPKLAICVYHKPEDIVTIPQYILSLVPQYRLYLRHYSFGDNETVLYAVI